MFEFQKRYNFAERAEESRRVREKYPTKIPIICELHAKDTNYKNHGVLDKSKYLVSEELTLAQFMQVIRKKISMDQSVAIFLFIKGRMYPSSTPMNNLYNQCKDLDGFLYVHYGFENVFG